ncbi:MULTISPECIES: DUF1329 domain-containing protein [Pseudomonas]|jgi:hypothetical protein|uniref:DUF1329 domain-containing protein n=2 Tax=Gammaproteobacteria TaxID=1236 RepID=A0A2T4G931_9PSED|nr:MULTISPECIES: DUF1329 domain-containing protein [Pseudomonas]AYF50835.1 DUF1329 domain-containing protein [Pseudomonas fluorescens]MBK5479250.1 DUF1329 domain-containing protein [Pseudomonas sp. TH21]OCW19277.1 outer membrane lipoprotein-sorting protein [Pseudomonas aylmerensis]PTC32191.1 DUF1329 domain-containing protein [Pseudomonas aylmerensis]QTV15132.1 DUF1329 domain-containing protein [Pseudomonas fluorescens]
MRKMILQCGVLALSLLAANVMAAVSPEEAAKLGTTLTPVGAEKAGNADGSIPAWTGGIPKNAGAVDSKGFLADPFASEKPLFVITAATVDKYKDKLSDGQVAMFKRYPDTYKIPVYPSHRTVNLPPEIYESIKRSALNVHAINDGNGLEGFTGNRYYAFPIPKNGVEVLWNHITRYHGGNLRRIITQATPQTNGSYTPIRFEEEVAVPQLIPDMDPAKGANVLTFFKQSVTAPARLAGNVLLVHETLDQVKEPRLAWIYNAGQRRVRRAPQVAYDGPGTAADGLRTSDNFDMFSGAPDRYDWKLVGKKEMYIPYNSYKLDSPSLKYDDIIKAGHINQDLTRYELHRVWEVVGTVKPSERHIYAKRHMYIDEDSWQVALVDHYDGRGQLWRVAEGHAQFYYNHQTPAYTVETLYDIIAGRYIALGMKNEEKSSFVFGFDAKAADYTPAALRASGVR